MSGDHDDLIAAVLALGVERDGPQVSPLGMVQRFIKVRNELSRMRDERARSDIKDWDHNHRVDEP